MKKTWLAVVAVVTMSVAGYQIANAGPGWGGMMGPGYGGYGNCQNYGAGPQGQGLDEEALAKREKFFEETTDLRKQMAVKGAELEALMNQEQPDEKKVASLTGEVFDLRNQLRTKARESGIQRGFGAGYCNGPYGGGPGMGRGYGRGGCGGPRSW